MNKKINQEALDHITVWECAVRSQDSETILEVKRYLEDTDGPYAGDERISISHNVAEGSKPRGQVTFPADSAFILSAALELMQDQ